MPSLLGLAEPIKKTDFFEKQGVIIAKLACTNSSLAMALVDVTLAQGAFAFPFD